MFVYLDASNLVTAMRVSKEMNRSCKLDTIWRAVLHRTWGTWLQGEQQPVNALQLYGSIVRGEYKFRRQIYDRISQTPLPSYLNSCVDAEVAFDKETGLFRAFYGGYKYEPHGRKVRHFYPSCDLREVPGDIAQMSGRFQPVISGTYCIGGYVEVQYSVRHSIPFAWYFGRVLAVSAATDSRHFVKVALIGKCSPYPVVTVTPGRRRRVRNPHPESPAVQVGAIRHITGNDLMTRFKRILSRSVISSPRANRPDIGLMRRDVLFTEMALDHYYTHADPEVCQQRDRLFRSKQSFVRTAVLAYDTSV
jgi:hypothetical protein